MKRSIFIQVMLIVALITAAAWYYIDLSKSIIPQGEVPAGIDTAQPYLKVTYKRVAPTAPTGFEEMHFYIPKDYVEYSGIQLNSGGSWPDYMVPLSIQLPSKAPGKFAPPQPWAGMRYDSPERKALMAEFHKTQFGTFYVTLNFGGGSAERFMREYQEIKESSPQEPYYAEIRPLAGLRRYAKLDCNDAYDRLDNIPPDTHPEFLKGRREERQALRAQAQPDDEPVPAKCLIDRRFVTYFTPLGTPEDEALYIPALGCDQWHCTCYINVGIRSVRFRIPIELLPRWREVVQPLRELLNSFLIEPSQPAPNSPAVSTATTATPNSPK